MINNTANNLRIETSKAKKDKQENKIRKKEEGFSVYFMGPNEERIKALRKKEQLDKLKNRSNNNSQSKNIRKKWEPVNSKPRLNYQAISKIILNDNLSKNFQNEIKTLDEMMNNINPAKTNSKEKRKRNWDDVNLGTHFSEFNEKKKELFNQSDDKNKMFMLDNLNDSQEVSISYERVPQNKNSSKNRPFSSILNLSKINGNESTKHRNTHIKYNISPKKDMTYKSPKTNIKPARPFSQINKSKQNTSMTSKKASIFTNREHIPKGSNITPKNNELKKKEIISKLDKLDEKKLNKLARVVDKLASVDDLLSSDTLTESKDSRLESFMLGNLKDKFNINYIKTESINFGNININVNNNHSKIKIFDNNVAENLTSYRAGANKSLLDSCVNRKNSLHIVIISNWGHSEKVGLTEIQLYDSIGEQIQILDCLISGYKSKIIDRLYNNIYQTSDENNMWVCPYIPGIKLEICYEPDRIVEKIKIWNFNGLDYTKCVKEIEILSNNTSQWKGIINRGNVENIVSLGSVFHDSIDDRLVKSMNMKFSEYDIAVNEHLLRTSLNSTIKKYMNNSNNLVNMNSLRNENEQIYSLRDENENYIQLTRMKIVLTSNYGNSNYIGLTGILLINEKNEEVNINEAISIGALPKDINTINDNCGDPRIFENIFNSLNEVVDDYYMWLTIFEKFSPPYIEIVFDHPVNLSSIKLWNYNKPAELDKCVKSVEIIINEDYSNPFRAILRQGIGEENLDYSQVIQFPISNITHTQDELEPFKHFKPSIVDSDYDTPYLPTGFVFKMNLLSTYGDINEIGLNNVEFYDQSNNNVSLNKILSRPKSEVDSLINGKGWITKYHNINYCNQVEENTFSNFFKQKQYNTLYFMFERPISVSYIHFTNIPIKGVKEIQIFCDDNLIYYGNLNETETDILFTSDITKTEIKLPNPKINTYKEIENDGEYVLTSFV